MRATVVAFARSFVKMVTHATNALMALGVAILFIILIGQVVSRYLMRVPFPWIEELSRYLMIWVALLGAGVGIQRKMHVGVSLFVSKVSTSIRRIVAVAMHLGMLTVIYVLVRYGLQISIFVRGQSTTTLPVSFFWAYLAMPVGAALMGVHIVFLLLQDIFDPEAIDDTDISDVKADV